MIGRLPYKSVVLEALEVRRLLSYWTIVDLGTLPGGSSSHAEAINASGQVVGYSDIGNGVDHAFAYSNGTMTDLGTLSGMTDSYAYGINASGEIVGTSGSYGFTDIGSTMTALTSTSAGGSDAYAVSSDGYVAGDLTDDSTVGGVNPQVATAFFNGVPTAIMPVYLFQPGGPGGDDGGSFEYPQSTARGVNDSGAVTGWTDEDGPTGAFIYNYNGDYSTEALGLDGGSDSYAYAINNSGQAVGYVASSSSGTAMKFAFIYVGGEMLDLDYLDTGDSEALAINNYGDAVGFAQPLPGQAAGHASGTTTGTDAFLFENRQMIDLNTLVDPSLGWTLESAQGININGQIVGYGVINGSTHAFLMTPPAPLGSGASATLTSGQLLVQGLSFNNTITLTTSGSTLTATVDGAASSFALTQINSIDVEGNIGDDSITLGAGVPSASVQSGPGNDTIVASTGNNTLGGGKGNDSITGGAGNDLIHGGEGDDTITAGSGNALIYGGPGFDILTAGAGNDTLMGGLGDDVLNGGAGNGYLNGGAGTNTFNSGPGVDTFYAINGADDLIDQAYPAQATNDVLYYSLNDTPRIQSGTNTIENQILFG